jgi:hypothetical protein
VAVAALREDRHIGQLYEVTGPRLWTFAEAVAEIARVTHRRIGFVQVSVEEYVAMLRAVPLPPEFVDLATYLLTEVLDGRNAWVADGVTRALGRPPRDFADYVRRTAASNVWNAGVEHPCGRRDEFVEGRIAGRFGLASRRPRGRAQ